MAVKVYCVKHESSHQVNITDLVKLIHIYQFNMAHYAYDEPLPENGISSANMVLSRTLCPLHDLDTINPETHPLSKVAQYVRFMVDHRGIRQRKSKKST